PEELQFEGKVVNKQIVKEFLQQLVSNLIFKIKFTAVPVDEEEADIFFEEMTLYIQHIAHYILQKKPIEVSGYLLELANIGSQCAVVYQEGLPPLCWSSIGIKDSINFLDLHSKLLHILHQSRWKWYRNQIAGYSLDANTSQYIQQQLEESLGLYTVHS